MIYNLTLYVCVIALHGGRLEDLRISPPDCHHERRGSYELEQQCVAAGDGEIGLVYPESNDERIVRIRITQGFVCIKEPAGDA